MERLKKDYEGFELYNAGLPNFKRNFTRDSIISAILMKDSGMLKNQLCFCALKQGKKKDSFTGEEPGKIFHEYPGFEIRRLSTQFNACDTTALFLIGHEFYQKCTNNKELAEKQKENIKLAVEYILSHLKDGLFYDCPKFSNAEKFAVKVTYWKDAWLVGRENNEPAYPVIYTLAHIQNMNALRAAANLLELDYLNDVAEKMSKALKELYNFRLDSFYIAIDEKGPIEGINSDILHALFYLEISDISDEQLVNILDSSKVLETPVGYRVLEPRLDSEEKGHYSNQVCPFEQAIIYIGAKKFGIKKLQEVSLRVMDVLDSDPEILVISEDKIKKAGPDPQLWTIAAKKYFEEHKDKDLF